MSDKAKRKDQWKLAVHSVSDSEDGDSVRMLKNDGTASPP